MHPKVMGCHPILISKTAADNHRSDLLLYSLRQCDPDIKISLSSLWHQAAIGHFDTIVHIGINALEVFIGVW